MIIEKDFNLKQYNTFHLNAVAKTFIIPQNVDELIETIKKIKDKNEKFYILSGGSNILINDEKALDNVIFMRDIDTSIVNMNEGRFYIGASNRIQNVIKTVNSYNYGGFEELFCLPAMFGGIIYMNAGIGGKENVLFNISDFIDRVKAINIENYEITYLNNQECKFARRKSIFQNNKYIILGAEVILKPQDKEISKEKIRKRKEFTKQKQEWGNGCFGTCFVNANSKILKFVKIISKTNGVKFSNNNNNWLVNNGSATYSETNRLIRKCILFHKLTFNKCELEVRFWN